MEAQVTVTKSAERRRGRVALPGLGDERLARLAAGGSEPAFTALYRRHHQALYRYCLSIVRQEADAQDALQATFAAALGALRRDQRNAPLRPWLFRIAHNESVNVLRRRPDCDEFSAEEHAGSGRSAEDQAGQHARFAQLLSDLGELPERARAALVMRELSGLGHDEIAAALETSPAAAKQAVFEARKALQEFAEGRATACAEIQRTISHGDGRALRGRRVRAHLGDCAVCAEFAAAISTRQADLRALAPVISPALAAGVLARTLGGAGAHAEGAAATFAGAAAGKAATVALTTKAVAAALTVTLVAGGTAVVRFTGHTASTGSLGAPALRTAGAPHAGHPDRTLFSTRSQVGGPAARGRPRPQQSRAGSALSRPPAGHRPPPSARFAARTPHSAAGAAPSVGPARATGAVITGKTPPGRRPTSGAGRRGSAAAGRRQGASRGAGAGGAHPATSAGRAPFRTRAQAPATRAPVPMAHPATPVVPAPGSVAPGPHPSRPPSAPARDREQQVLR